ncbi:hypothetical protein P3S67_003456 [Capsicum chacoense]
MEVVIATVLSGSTEDSSKDQELDVNCKYFDILSGAKKIMLSDQVAEECIKILEKKMSYMRENQERIPQERVELEVQQRVEQEVSRLRLQSDDRFKSMEEQWSRMMSDMKLSSRSFSNPTLPNRDSSNT